MTDTMKSITLKGVLIFSMIGSYMLFAILVGLALVLKSNGISVAWLKPMLGFLVWPAAATTVGIFLAAMLSP